MISFKPIHIIFPSVCGSNDYKYIYNCDGSPYIHTTVMCLV